MVSLASALGFRGSRAALLRLGDPPDVVRELGIVRGEPSWSEDGRRLAWCTAASATVVLDLDSGLRERLAGCRPRVAPDGSVLTRPDRLLTSTLLRDGRVFLREEDLVRPYPPGSEGPLDVVGYDLRPDGLLAVVTVRFEPGRRPRRLLQLWRGKRLERAILLPELNLPAGAGRLGDRVEFDPSGREVAVSFPGAGKEMILVDVEDRLRRTTANEPARLRLVPRRTVVRALDRGGDPHIRLRSTRPDLRPPRRRSHARLALGGRRREREHEVARERDAELVEHRPCFLGREESIFGEGSGLALGRSPRRPQRAAPLPACGRGGRFRPMTP